jgi:hypothetical protein
MSAQICVQQTCVESLLASQSAINRDARVVPTPIALSGASSPAAVVTDLLLPAKASHKEPSQHKHAHNHVRVNFVNDACASMSVEWIQPKTNRRIMKGQIAPGQMFEQLSEVGHAFVFRFQLPQLDNSEKPSFTKSGYRQVVGAGKKKITYRLRDVDHLLPCTTKPKAP